MNKYMLILTLVFVAGFSACKKEEQTIITTLTNQEEADLKFMREEEKLARDVYRFAFEMYGLSSFDNIAESEQRHMDSVLGLLEKYDVEDPSAGFVQGEFSNQDLQALYDELISTVSLSEVDALIAGATIEDLDINDLEVAKAQTTKNDLERVYDNLMCGSRNHLRSFYDLLDSDYEPQFIDLETFEWIVSTGNEQCGSN